MRAPVRFSVLLSVAGAAVGTAAGCGDDDAGSTIAPDGGSDLGDARASDAFLPDDAASNVSTVRDSSPDAPPFDAGDAADARDARDASDAADARDARDARDASDAADARDASDASDANDAATGTTVTLRYERDYLNLVTGAVVPSNPLTGEAPAGTHLRIAYNAGTAVHAVVFHVESTTQIAHLPNRTFDSVTSADIATASFQTAINSTRFDAARVVLIKITASGAVYKLGDPVENTAGFSLTFKHAKL